jgi:hypothetical protein
LRGSEKGEEFVWLLILVFAVDELHELEGLSMIVGCIEGMEMDFL